MKAPGSAGGWLLWMDRYYNDLVRSLDREVLGRLCRYLHFKPGVTDFAVKPLINRATKQQNRRLAQR